MINLSSILLLLALVPTRIIESAPKLCVFKNIIIPLFFQGHCPITGFFLDCSCPACGLTQAMSHLLHGEVSIAWGYNKGIFLVLLVMISLMAINGWKWYKVKK